MGNLEFLSKLHNLEDGSSVALVELKGSIDGSTVKKFESEALGLYEKGVKFVILNFAQIGYMNSTGLGILVKVLDKFQEKDGDVKLVRVPPKVADLFEMLGISSILTIHKSVDEAIATLPAKILPQAPEPVDAPPAVPSGSRLQQPPQTTAHSQHYIQESIEDMDDGVTVSPDVMNLFDYQETMSTSDEQEQQPQQEVDLLSDGIEINEGGITIGTDWGIDSLEEETSSESFSEAQPLDFDNLGKGIEIEEESQDNDGFSLDLTGGNQSPSLSLTSPEELAKEIEAIEREEKLLLAARPGQPAPVPSAEALPEDGDDIPMGNIDYNLVAADEDRQEQPEIEYLPVEDQEKIEEMALNEYDFLSPDDARQPMEEINMEELAGDATEEEPLEEISMEELAGDATEEEPLEEISMEELAGDATEEEPLEEISMEELAGDTPLEEIAIDGGGSNTAGEEPEEIAMGELAGGIPGAGTIEEISMDELADDASGVEPIEEIAMDKLAGDTASEEEAEEIAMDDLAGDTAGAEPIEEIVMDEPVGDAAGAEPIEEIVMDEPVGDAAGAEPIEEIVMDEPADDAAGAEPIKRSSWMSRLTMPLVPSRSKRSSWMSRLAMPLMPSRSKRSSWMSRLAMPLMPSRSKRSSWMSRLAMPLMPSRSKRSPWMSWMEIPLVPKRSS